MSSKDKDFTEKKNFAGKKVILTFLDKAFIFPDGNTLNILFLENKNNEYNLEGGWDRPGNIY